jgi:hypothetical protein
MSLFTLGDTVIFEPKNLNQDYWNGLTKKEKSRYYGVYYDYTPSSEQTGKLFTFITYHSPQVGHCVLMDMDDGKLLPMCHDNDFRRVTHEEC